MTVMHRLLPPVAVNQQTRIVNGRSYGPLQPGTVIDVPSFDSEILQANGWALVAQVGPTSARPTPSLNPVGPEGSQAGPGAKYHDSTIGALIVTDGVTWRSAVNGDAV
jgi:hypothetical protein